MTIIRSNSISGINSITAAPGANLQFFDSTGASLSLDTGNVNAGVLTATTVRVTGDLTVEGTTTTLDTVVTEVDKLEVNANNSTVGVAITQSGAGDILRLYDGASQVVTVKNGGSVGIGTDNPTFLLQVQNDSESLARFRRENTGSNQGGIIVGNQSRAIKITGGNDGLIITDNTLGLERLRIDSSGNIGIGNTTPAAKLEVSGDAIFTQTSASIQTDCLQLGFTAPNGFIKSKNSSGSPASNLDFYSTDTGGNTNLGIRLQYTGNVGIGTASPSDKLSVYGGPISLFNTSTNNRVFQAGTTNGHGLMKVFRSDAEVFLRVDSDARKFGIGTDNPGHLLYLKSTGDARIHIEADSDNVGENDNPRISFSQDGSTSIQFEIGLEGDANATMTNTLANAAIISANNNASQPLQLGHMGNAFMTLRNDLVGIGTNNPASKLHIEDGSVFVDNGSVTANYHSTKGSGVYLARSFRYDNYKTGWSNGAWVSHYRFTRSFSQANNGIIGVIGGMLHIVYVNERTNAVQTSGYDSFPIIVRARSNDTMSIGIGAAIANVDTVIGSSVEVQVANASATSIDLQIRIYNSDGANGENFCHSWIDFGGAASHNNQFPEISLL